MDSNCTKCGAATLVFHHYMTASRIEVDPFPHPEGTVVPHFASGTCAVPPKGKTKYQSWRVHICALR